MCPFRRILFPAIGFVGLAWISSDVLAQSTADSGTNLWPFQVGNSWTFQTPNKDKVVTTVVTVTGVVAGKDSSRATVEYRSGSSPLEIETYKSNALEITRLTSGPNGRSKIYPGLPIVHYPLMAGSTWYWNGTITTNGKRAEAAAKMTASGPEPVTEPAGKFQAFKVHMDLVFQVGQRKITIPNDYWFAPGVGLVRRSATVGNTTVVSSLMQYKLPQAAPHP